MHAYCFCLASLGWQNGFLQTNAQPTCQVKATVKSKQSVNKGVDNNTDKVQGSVGMIKNVHSFFLQSLL